MANKNKTAGKIDEETGENMPATLTIENKETLTRETLTTELHFDLLKQFAWLSSAAIGAIVVMLQLNAIESNKDVFVSLALFGFSILTAIFGQDFIVDALLKGKNIYQIAKQLNRVRFITMFCFGIGAGYFAASIFLS